MLHNFRDIEQMVLELPKGKAQPVSSVFTISLVSTDTTGEYSGVTLEVSPRDGFSMDSDDVMFYRDATAWSGDEQARQRTGSRIPRNESLNKAVGKFVEDNVNHDMIFNSTLGKVKELMSQHVPGYKRMLDSCRMVASHKFRPGARFIMINEQKVQLKEDLTKETTKNQLVKTLAVTYDPEMRQYFMIYDTFFMMTSAIYEFLLNRDSYKSLQDAYFYLAVFFFSHEMGHILRYHLTNTNASVLGDVPHNISNRAGDAFINIGLGRILKDSGLVKKETFPSVGILTEEIYKGQLHPNLVGHDAQAAVDVLSDIVGRYVNTTRRPPRVYSGTDTFADDKAVLKLNYPADYLETMFSNNSSRFIKFVHETITGVLVKPKQVKSQASLVGQEVRDKVTGKTGTVIQDNGKDGVVIAFPPTQEGVSEFRQVSRRELLLEDADAVMDRIAQEGFTDEEMDKLIQQNPDTMVRRRYDQIAVIQRGQGGSEDPILPPDPVRLPPGVEIEDQSEGGDSEGGGGESLGDEQGEQGDSQGEPGDQGEQGDSQGEQGDSQGEPGEQGEQGDSQGEQGEQGEQGDSQDGDGESSDQGQSGDGGADSQGGSGDSQEGEDAADPWGGDEESDGDEEADGGGGGDQGDSQTPGTSSPDSGSKKTGSKMDDLEREIAQNMDDSYDVKEEDESLDSDREKRDGDGVKRDPKMDRETYEKARSMVKDALKDLPEDAGERSQLAGLGTSALVNLDSATKGKWKLALRRLMRRAMGVTTRDNPNIPSARIEGELGREVDVKKIKTVVLLVDCSGSMGPRQFREVISHISVLAKTPAFRGTKFETIYWGGDSSELRHKTFRRASSLYNEILSQAPSYGGTDLLYSVIYTLEDRRLAKADMFICFTDGYLRQRDLPAEKEGAWKRILRRMIWVITANGSTSAIRGSYDPAVNRRMIKQDPLGG